jgi:hypothetical protein
MRRKGRRRKKSRTARHFSIFCRFDLATAFNCSRQSTGYPRYVPFHCAVREIAVSLRTPYRVFEWDRGSAWDIQCALSEIRVSGSWIEILRICTAQQWLGKVPFYFDIRSAISGDLIWTTDERELIFANRRQVVQLAMTIENCPFERPGVYLIELYCKAEWVCDTRLELR